MKRVMTSSSVILEVSLTNIKLESSQDHTPYMQTAKVRVIDQTGRHLGDIPRPILTFQCILVEWCYFFNPGTL
jgi:hypothetical protein